MRTHICAYIYIYIYIYIPGPHHAGVREQKRSTRCHTVSFHNFKSQNFKLSVSNPKSKYVVYLSVLSQMSNCQSLGRKNKHEILKTDHIIKCSNMTMRHRIIINLMIVAINRTLIL